MAKKVIEKDSLKKGKTANKKTTSKKTTVKKAEPKKKSTPVKKVKVEKKEEVVVEEPKKESKKEPWYVWLKNNIIENEKQYSKEYRHRRLFVSLFVILCFLVVFLSTAIIDYSYSTKNNTYPKIAFVREDEYKQAKIYYGLFYKAWNCENGNTDVNYGRFSSDIGYCKYEVEYDNNNIYVNPNGIKISKSQMNIINNYYYDDFMYFETEKDLEDAYKISTEINKNWWVRVNPNKVIENNPEIGLAIFGKNIKTGFVESWEIQYNDYNYYKCVKNVNNENIFANYNGETNTCGSYWERLSIDEETCKLAKNNIPIIKNLVTITGLCK